MPSILVCDFDGDNDVLTQYFIDQIFFYENVAQKPGELPQLATGRNIVSKDYNGGHLHYVYFQIPMQWCDVDGDGRNEIAAGSNPGHIVIFEIRDGQIVGEHIIEGKGVELGTDLLAVPALGDINGDGLVDLVVADGSGFVKQFLNVGTAEKPAFGPVKYVEAGGERIFVQAPGGSIQGPVEARWGYLQAALHDWDGDGLIDLFLSDIHGRNLLCRNVGTKERAVFAAPKSLRVDGRPLVTRWRSKPTLLQHRGKLCYLQTDENGHVAFFERDPSKGLYEVVRRGPIRYADGKPVQLDSNRQGKTFSARGRIKLEICDWDRNGVWDIIFGVNRVSPVAKEYGCASLHVLLNTGDNDNPRFAAPRVVTYRGEVINLGVHSCSPAVADIDSDGEEEFFVGDEDGRIRLYQRGDLGLEP